MAEPQPGLDGDVGQSAFLLAGYDLDLDARALADGVDERRAVGCDSQPCRSDRRDLVDSTLLCLFCHGHDRLDRPLDRPLPELSGLVEAFAKAGDLGAVGDRRPVTVRLTLADVELDGVRADVDGRIAPRPESDERLQAAREADVPTRAQAELANGLDHASGVLRFHGDRSPRSLLCSYLGALCHAAADGVVLALLVHSDREQVRARPDDLVDELVERVCGAGERRTLDPERHEHREHLLCGKRVGRFHDGLPLLETILVHGLELLHIHETVANLDGGVAAQREQVDLVALLDPLRPLAREPRVGLAEALTEGAPLPAGNDGLTREAAAAAARAGRHVARFSRCAK